MADNCCFGNFAGDIAADVDARNDAAYHIFRQRSRDVAVYLSMMMMRMIVVALVP
jgi:hypothetical protein